MSDIFNLEKLLLFSIEKLSSREISQLTQNYASLMYSKNISKKYKFYFRTLCKISSCSQWMIFIQNNSILNHCAQYERIVEKPHRPYCRSYYNFKQRLKLLKEHYAIMSTCKWCDLVKQAYIYDATITNFETKSGRIFTLYFCRPSKFIKEGEITLALKENNIRFYSATFSFHYIDENSIKMDIGSVQGPKNENAKELIRELTKDLHALRPRSLMIEVLRTIAKVSNVSQIQIVGNESHVFNHLRKNKKILFDYDEFSKEIGGYISNNKDWIIPIETNERPIEMISSNKRAEAKRRRALVDEIKNGVMNKLMHH